MPHYTEPFDEVTEAIVNTFLLAALGLCLGVAFALGVTAEADEDLMALIFWPLVGATGFGIALFNLWATKPWDYTNTVQK